MQRGVSRCPEGQGEFPHTEACRKRMAEAIAETDEGRERAKAAGTRIREFRAGGREMEIEEPAAKRAKRARGSDESMEAEIPDSCAGAAWEPMEDDAEDRMEKQKRGSGWEDKAERTKRPRKDDDDEDMLLEVVSTSTRLGGRRVRGRAGSRGGLQRRPERQEARPEESAAGQGGGIGGARVAGLRGGGRRGVRQSDWEEADPGEVGGRRLGLRRLPEQARLKGFQAEKN